MVCLGDISAGKRKNVLVYLTTEPTRPGFVVAELGAWDIGDSEIRINSDGTKVETKIQTPMAEVIWLDRSTTTQRVSDLALYDDLVREAQQRFTNYSEQRAKLTLLIEN